VGAVLADPADTLAWQMLAAAEQCLSAHNLGMLVRVASAASPVAVCAQTLAERGVDALLFAGSGRTPGRETGKPGGLLPLIGCGHPPGSGMPPSEAIEQRGLALARADLQQLGHVHVGTLAPRRIDDPHQRTVSQDATIPAEQVDRLDDTDAVRAGVRRLIESGVTAIVTLSDVAAAAALRECSAMGIAVPEQLSVIGWGDTALARCVDPQLTSVRLPASASGQAAAEYLVATLSGRPFTWADLPLKLVIRESTGPIAGEAAQRST
jgi:DNA-binding LacI/PurR family transcriptional regulator